MSEQPGVATPAPESRLAYRRRRVPVAPIAGALVLLASAAVAGALVPVLGGRLGFVAAVGLVAIVASAGIDTSVRYALLLLPFVSLLRRLTAGPAAYVPNDPLVLLLPLLILPALVIAPALPTNRAGRARGWWIGLLTWWTINGLVLSQGAFQTRLFSFATIVLPALLAFAIVEGRYPGLVQFAWRSVAVLAPLVALYGLFQWTSDPTWDMAWLSTVHENLISVGFPKHGQYRIFATLESPGPAATYLGLGLVLLMAVLACRQLGTRFGGLRVIVGTCFGGLIMWVLLLTAVRSVLFAVPVVGLAVILIVPRQTRARIALPAAALAIAGFLAPGLLAGQVFATSSDQQRLHVNDLGSDMSFQARVEALSGFSTVLRRPLGSGLGTSGIADRLGDSGGGTVNVDNGYLAIAAETGAAGFVLFLGLVGQGLRSGLRGLRTAAPGSRDQQGLACAYLIVIYYLAQLLTGSALSSSGGIFFWLALAGLFPRKTRADVQVASPPPGSAAPISAGINPA